MDAQFTAIIKKLAAERGRETLFTTAKCKALLADYTRGEYNKESRVFLQAVEAGIAKTLAETTEIEACKIRMIRRLQDEYFLSQEAAADVIETLCAALDMKAPPKKPAVCLCPACGKELQESWKACPYCGAAAADTGSQKSQTLPSAPVSSSGLGYGISLIAGKTAGKPQTAPVSSSGSGYGISLIAGKTAGKPQTAPVSSSGSGYGISLIESKPTGKPQAAPVSSPQPTPAEPQSEGRTFFLAAAMIKKRGLARLIILSIITFGIYGLYWIHHLAKDVNAICEEDGKKTGGLLRFLFLDFITFGIYGLVWLYMLGDRLRDNAPRYNLAFKEGGSTVLLWYILGTFIIVGPFIALHIIIKNTNAMADEYNKRALHRWRNA